MKTSIKALLFAIVATLTFSACSSDDCPTVETKDLVGKWSMGYADKNIQTEGSLFYTLNADGSCTIKHEEYLAKPEEQRPEESGIWFVCQYEGKTLLVLCDGLMYYTSSDNRISQTVRLTITKFSKNKFHAFSENSTQEKIFYRMK